jgi:arylformamidase
LGDDPLPPPLYRQYRTQQELDAEYDIERSVPDFEAYARHYVDQSKLARHRLDCKLDVRYGPTLEEHLDIFPAVRQAPILVFFHGGYWRTLSSKEFSCVALGPVAAGIALVNVNYSLCPSVTIDEIVRQARAALAWTWRKAESFGGNREQIYVSGHSAGAHMAAMTLATDWPGDFGLPADLIKGAFCLSGLYDLRPLPFCFVQPSLQLTAGQVLRNSPMLAPPAGCPSQLMVSVGGKEPAEFQRQTHDFLASWQVVGNHGEAVAQPESDHFSILFGLEEPTSILSRALFRLMRIVPPVASRRTRM